VLNSILIAFTHIFSFYPFIGLFFGVIVGLVVGAMPGVNDSITMAVLIPITFGMDPKIALLVLVGIYCSACYGGSLPAILLNIPGTASSVVTTIDGHPMALKGEAGKAIAISTYSSVFGGLMSSLVLMFFAPFLANQALRFGPPEYFCLAVLGMATVAGMAGKSLIKNLIAGILALIISTIGMSPQTGFPRFCFGNTYLLDGIPFIPALIGFFGITSVLELSENIVENEVPSIKISKVKKVFLGKKLIKRLLPTWLISGGIGNIIGVIPGAGMVMAVFMAYRQAVSRNKDKKFGTGIPEGIAAPEAANNAVVASSMVPLLSLGIPGNSTSALFLGALMIQGLRPGPLLFKDHPDLAYLIIVGFFIANILMGPIGLAMGNFFVKILPKIPRKVLSGIIVAICATGAFAMNNSIFGILIMLIFGVLGYVLNKLEIPYSPIILGMILGPMMERNLWQSLIISHGDPFIFLKRPLSLFLLILALILFFAPFFVLLKNKTKREKDRNI